MTILTIDLATGQQTVREYTEQELAELAIYTHPAIPKSVTRFQAKAALLSAGLLEQVEAYMAQPDTPMVTKLAWTETLNFDRNSQTVSNLSVVLGLTGEQVDALFIEASGISA